MRNIREMNQPDTEQRLKRLLLIISDNYTNGPEQTDLVVLRLRQAIRKLQN